MCVCVCVLSSLGESKCNVYLKAEGITMEVAYISQSSLARNHIINTRARALTNRNTHGTFNDLKSNFGCTFFSCLSSDCFGTVTVGA